MFRADGIADPTTTIHDNVSPYCGGISVTSAEFASGITWSGGAITSHTLSGRPRPWRSVCLDATVGTIEVSGIEVRDNTAGFGGGVFTSVNLTDPFGLSHLAGQPPGGQRGHFGGGPVRRRPKAVDSVDRRSCSSMSRSPETSPRTSGGGIALAQANLSMTDGTVTDNVAVVGGGWSSTSTPARTSGRLIQQQPPRRRRLQRCSRHQLRPAGRGWICRV
jgi:hypothetical protein